MDKLDATTVATVRATLAELFGDDRWERLLELVAVLGVADAQQLQTALGWSRGRLAGVLDKLAQAAPGLPPILTLYTENVARPGTRGAPPRVFLLDKTGAALLRQLGYPDTQPCGYQEPPAIAHALGILDAYLLAQQAGLPVVVERRLPAGDALPYIRPDALVTLADGEQVIVEIEQVLTAQHVGRALKSVQHKVAFYPTPAGQDVSPIIRILYLLPPGPDYERTLKVWRQAILGVRQRHGGTLPCRFLAAPLTAFKAAPDWHEPPTAPYWTDLSTPPASELATPNSSLATPNSSLLTPNSSLAPRAPKPLRRYSTHESGLLLNALWQNFQEITQATGGRAHYAEVALFEVAGIIYAASHDPFLAPLERAAHPHAALYLLNQYLRWQAPLRELLVREIPRGAQVIRWNSIAITHRMQVVCTRFLQYHGFSDRGPLLVRATSADFRLDEPQYFQVRVTIQDREILLAGNGVLPDAQLVRAAESALAWVLTALFLYAEDLGLPRLPFW